MKKEIMVQVPSTTLNAIKKMLFNAKEGGVDLTSIISDLSMGQENDLIAINVGLTFKGYKPDIDERTRYSAEYRELARMKFLGFSLINDMVLYEKEYQKFSKSEGKFVEDWVKISDKEITTLENWMMRNKQKL